MNKMIFIFYFIPFSLFSQEYFPKSNGELIKHTFYSLSYAEDHEQAEWVHYKITPLMLKGNVKRTNYFKIDRKVSTGSANTKDYLKSGYDRGHLAPAADMKLSKLSMSESFYMSNVSPQKHSFNAGAWLKLEKLVRAWAKTSELYITTGGVLNSKYLKTIGNNNVSVPEKFYKIIYDPRNQKIIAFLMANEKLDLPIEKYIVTVDEIESLTGIDFYHQLDDELEEKMESTILKRQWFFN